LHPDVGGGASFAASWARSGGQVTGERSGACRAAADDADNAEGAAGQVGSAAREWRSVPLGPPPPRWEPSPGDELHALAAAIVLDVPLRNGPTPPPIEHEVEPFDRGALERLLDDPEPG